jgi:hypothetical protein
LLDYYVPNKLIVGSSLTLQLTDEEIAQLLATGELEREVIRFNATCDNGKLDFNSLSYEGDGKPAAL